MHRLQALNKHFCPQTNAAINHNLVERSMKEELILQEASDNIVTFRFLQRDDYKRGFPKVLEGLTKGCNYSQAEFEERYDSMFPSEA